MDVKLLYLATVWVATACHARAKSYEDYKVYTIEPLGNGQLELLSDFTSNRQYDFWTPLRTKGPSDVMVKPETQSEFEEFLKTHGIPYSLKIENLERVLEIEKAHQVSSRNAPGEISFTKYNRYGEILAYLKKLAVTHKHLVSLEAFAKTGEKRDLMVVKISTGGSNKPTILIDGGIHAREWIAPAQVLFIIKELVENPKNRKMIENVDWHIIPVLNPDGYEYSHTNDRFWRKTRSKHGSCEGVDPNRNFDFYWGGDGTSSDECDNLYKGPKPFSESETRGLRDLILKNRGKYKLYLTFHSYGQLIMFPWGYADVLPEDADELRSLGNMAANAIQNVNGTRYEVGSVTELLVPGAGGSDDWAKAVGGIKYVYCIEMPEGTGSGGFHINPSKILPIVRETFEGIRAFHSFVEKL